MPKITMGTTPDEILAMITQKSVSMTVKDALVALGILAAGYVGLPKRKTISEVIDSLHNGPYLANDFNGWGLWAANVAMIVYCLEEVRDMWDVENMGKRCETEDLLDALGIEMDDDMLRSYSEKKSHKHV